MWTMLKMGENVHILLIEDDDVDVMLVEAAFKKNNIVNPITRAVDGLDALDKMKAKEIKQPYLVLLDLNMPRMNGLEFLEEIRHDPNLMDSTIFVFTTSQAEQDKLQAYQHNIAGYLVKNDVDQQFAEIINFLDRY
jgi:CheY-like chemotaxis protein